MVYNFQQLSTKILETLELLVSFRDGTSTGEGMEKGREAPKSMGRMFLWMFEHEKYSTGTEPWLS
jgi:hypothetical protein